MSENPEIQKGEYFHIRLNKREKSAIRQASSAMGMSMSDFVRSIIMGASTAILTEKRGGGHDFPAHVGAYVEMVLRLRANGLPMGDQDKDDDGSG